MALRAAASDLDMAANCLHYSDRVILLTLFPRGPRVVNFPHSMLLQHSWALNRQAKWQNNFICLVVDAAGRGGESSFTLLPSVSKEMRWKFVSIYYLTCDIRPQISQFRCRLDGLEAICRWSEEKSCKQAVPGEQVLPPPFRLAKLG